MTRLAISLVLCLLVLSACSKVSKMEPEIKTAETMKNDAEMPLTAEGIIHKTSESLAGISDAKLIEESFDDSGRIIGKMMMEYKSPGMYRIEATNAITGTNHLFVSNGKTRWHYQMDDKLALSSPDEVQALNPDPVDLAPSLSTFFY